MHFTSVVKRSMIIIIVLHSVQSIYSQTIKPYVGIHGGINFTQPNVLTNYEIITTINGDDISEHEYYKIFKNFGHQIGFTILLNINDHFSLGFSPEISTYSYGYESEDDFYNSQGDSVLIITNNIKSKLTYFNFPLLIQYKLRSGPFIPYLFAGGAYSLLRNAQQSVEVLSVLQNQGNNFEFGESITDNYTSGYIRSKISVFAGIGAMYEFSSFNLALDASYWFGLNNIVNESNRFGNNSISGSTYTLSDDVTLNHLVINATILFPINKNNANGKKGSLDCIPLKNRKN